MSDPSHPADRSAPADPSGRSGRITVLVNPRSGSFNDRTLDEISYLCTAHGLDAKLHLLAIGEDPAVPARAAVQEGCPVVVAAGGDGTVSATATALAHGKSALGVLPMGTLNHFAKDLKIPLDLDGAIAVIAGRRIAAIDLGEVNGHTFVNNSSLGIYPLLVHLREHEQRRGRAKWVAFARALAAVLRRYPFLSVRLSTNGESIAQTTPCVFIGNNEYRLEGFDLGTRSRIDSGRLFLYVAAPLSRDRLLWTAVTALLGRLDRALLQVFPAEEAWLDTNHRHLRVATDGEVRLLNRPFHYRVLPGALRVVVPPQP